MRRAWRVDADTNSLQTNACGGHFLTDDVAGFDAAFFGINPIEAKVYTLLSRDLGLSLTSIPGYGPAEPAAPRGRLRDFSKLGPQY